MAPASTIALAAAVLLAYTYAGYPALIGLLARLRPAPLRRDPAFTPTVSACVAVYNGAAHIEAKLRSLQALDYPPDRLEFLVYSDGSTDGTNAIVARLAASDARIVALRSSERLGKPTALNAMARAARGEVLLMTDARQRFEPDALRALVAPLADPSVACVSGNLVLRGAAGAGAYWRYEKWIRKQEGRFRTLQGVTGAIYAIRAADLAPLPPDVILDDMWIPMRLVLAGRRVVFAEDAVAYDEAFEDHHEFRRKARTLAGNFQLLALLPQLLNPLRNPSFFETLSHKVLRLAGPFLLVILFVASGLAAFGAPAPAPGLRGALGALWLSQILFYLVALFPRLGGRIGAAARSFVVMNCAALVGLVRFLRGTHRITW